MYKDIALMLAALLSCSTTCFAWQYGTTHDEMGRGTTYGARVESANELDLAFPYNGPQRARLLIRELPNREQGVAIMLTRGQILCPLDSCYFAVRFDDQPLRDTEFVPSTNGSAEFVFVADPKRFIDRIKKAETVRIEIALFQDGNKVIRFDVGGLEWPMPRTPN